mmetsp:Transcript_73102/g.117875  ORF Transcript_73102/g.117875 Transcript_73102/m.117875 type:complete len:251 (+) Transcript_73102:145-897(+)
MSAMRTSCRPSTCSSRRCRKARTPGFEGGATRPWQVPPSAPSAATDQRCSQTSSLCTLAQMQVLAWLSDPRFSTFSSSWVLQSHLRQSCHSRLSAYPLPVTALSTGSQSCSSGGRCWTRPSCGTKPTSFSRRPWSTFAQFILQMTSCSASPPFAPTSPLLPRSSQPRLNRRARCTESRWKWRRLSTAAWQTVTQQVSRRTSPWTSPRMAFTLKPWMPLRWRPLGRKDSRLKMGVAPSVSNSAQIRCLAPS